MVSAIKLKRVAHACYRWLDQEAMETAYVEMKKHQESIIPSIIV